MGTATMVLVSFEKQFIYTKTVKTAGTSVEIFLEPYCLAADSYVQIGPRDESITGYGVVGFRGANRPADVRWYNHMPAAQIREYLGEEVWNEFFKFCVIRNPYDKLRSMYLFELDRANSGYGGSQDFSELRRNFIDWIRRRRFLVDRNKYVIDGSVCLDYYIRFESLTEGLKEVCQKLAIDRDVAELGRFKSGDRRTDRHFSEFYDEETRKIVAEAFALELDHFGYRFEE
jgi:hypothetical protein